MSAATEYKRMIQIGVVVMALLTYYLVYPLIKGFGAVIGQSETEQIVITVIVFVAGIGMWINEINKQNFYATANAKLIAERDNKLQVTDTKKT